MVDFPTAYTMHNEKLLKIIETKVASSECKSVQCGEIVCVTKNGIEINTKSGTILITKVKPESKGVMNAFDFANGAKLQPKMKLGE